MKTQDTRDLSDMVDSCILESPVAQPKLLKGAFDYAETYLIYEG